METDIEEYPADTGDRDMGEDEYVSRKEFEMLTANIGDYRSTLKEQLREIDGSLKAMWQKIDGRPSWSVLAIITLLTSLVVGLIVGILVK